jgi:hypothetical protein
MPRYDEVWNRIVSHTGKLFKTKRGLEFTYSIEADIFVPSRTNYRINKCDFEKAYALVPFDGPGIINNTVRGPAYILAVLHDQSIRQNDSERSTPRGSTP